jgi:hypothetical protein
MHDSSPWRMNLDVKWPNLPGRDVCTRDYESNFSLTASIRWPWSYFVAFSDSLSDGYLFELILLLLVRSRELLLSFSMNV